MQLLSDPASYLQLCVDEESYKIAAFKISSKAFLKFSACGRSKICFSLSLLIKLHFSLHQFLFQCSSKLKYSASVDRLEEKA